MNKRHLLAATALGLGCMVAVAAGDVNCKGVLVNEEGEPIIGATITVPGTKIAAVSDLDGNFSITTPPGKKLQITYIGYKPITVEAAPQLGEMHMQVQSEMLQDVVITQSIARTRKTPVAVSAIDGLTLETKLGNQELPEILKTTPGVWATKDGGGVGDAKINIRGFRPSNTATMVNGIPVNDMEWGGIYWSNWNALTEVTASMQVQRGLGATMISAPSFGGTINMVTKGLDAKRGGSVWYGLGNDNAMNYGISFSTGLMKNGWAVTFLGSHRTGNGYIQGTEFDYYTYFLNVSKRLNEQHQLSLTVVGGPQTHNKRSSSYGLSIEGWQDVANYMPRGETYRYNPYYGYGLDGQRMSSQVNRYNKPVAMLNHTWQINHKQTLSNVIYASLGTGGGTSGQGATSTLRGYWNPTDKKTLRFATYEDQGQTYFFTHANGQYAYDQVQLMNSRSTTGSLMCLSNSVNNHRWFGGVSNYRQEIDDHFTVTGGLDVRYYYGEHTNKISDLCYGAYYIDPDRSSSANKRTFATDADKQAYRQQKLGVGDVIYRDWDSRIWQEGIYAQGEYQGLDNKLNVVLAGAVNVNTYTRYEHYYVDADQSKSPTKSFWAGNVKAGANYNIDRNNNVFVNGGYITRAPYLQYGVFISPANSNAINPNPRNEKVAAVELGYEYHSPKFTAKVNGYYINWMDRTMITTGTLAYSQDRYTATMQGVDSRYMGVELDFVYKPTRWAEFSGMFSLADNTWQNDPVGYFYNSQGEALSSLGDKKTPETFTTPLAEDHLNARIDQKGVKVGGSAQMTTAIGAVVKPFRGMRIGADWTGSARNYSDFQLNSYSSTTLTPGQTLKIADPWRIPFGNQLDLHASYNFPITDGVRCTFSANVYNVYNNQYIMDCYTDHDKAGTWETAYNVMYSFGRTFSLRAKVTF